MANQVMKQIADKLISSHHTDNIRTNVQDDVKSEQTDDITRIKLYGRYCINQAYATEPACRKTKIKDDSFKLLSLEEKNTLWFEGDVRVLERVGLLEKDIEVEDVKEELKDYNAVDVTLHDGETDTDTSVSNDEDTTHKQNNQEQDSKSDAEVNPSNQDGQDIQSTATESVPHDLELCPQVHNSWRFTSHKTEMPTKGLQALWDNEDNEGVTALHFHGSDVELPIINPFRNSAQIVHDAADSLAGRLDPEDYEGVWLTADESTPALSNLEDKLIPSRIQLKYAQPLRDPALRPRPIQVSIFPVDGRPRDGGPDIRSEIGRLSTFSKLPSLEVSAIRLAQSGFYYDEEQDEIICYSCGVKKRHWHKTDRVAMQHLAISPGCEHANFEDERNVAETPYPYSPREAESSQNISRDGDMNMVTDGESMVNSSPLPAQGPALSAALPSPAKEDSQQDSKDNRSSAQMTTKRAEDNHSSFKSSQNSSQTISAAADGSILSASENSSSSNGVSRLQTDSANNGITPSRTPTDPSSNEQSLKFATAAEQQQNSNKAVQSADITLPANDTTTYLGDRNYLSSSSSSTRKHTQPPTVFNLGGNSLDLPTPAGRTEQLQRNRQMAAQSAGTARPGGTGSSSLIETSVAVPTTNEPTGKQQIGVHNTEAAHTGTCSDVPMLDHFNPSVQAHLSTISLQSPQAVPATTLVNYSVQVVQAPNANPFQRGSSNQYRHNEGNEDGGGELPGNGLLDMRRAASPENALVSVRLATFLDWPTRGLPNRRLLVIAGFYYMGTGDSVRCFYCGVTLRNWRENDDPWVTHVRFRFSCDYVKAIKGEDFVYRVLLQVALGHAISSETCCITSSESAAVANGIDNSSTSCSSQQTSPTPIANTASAYAANSNAASHNATAASGTTVPSTAARSSTTVGMSIEAPRGPGSCSTTEQGSEHSSSRSDMNAEGNRDQATLRSRDASEGASTSSTENGPDAMGTGKQGKGNNKGGASKAAANTDGASVGTYAQNGVEVLQTDAEPDKHRSTATLPQTSQQTVAVGDQSLTFQSTVSTEYPTVPTAGVAGNHGDATSFQQLQETNHRLRRRVTCRLCGNRPVDTIFLPCGHLCTCETCAATIRMCCLCNDRIRGTAHVYME